MLRSGVADARLVGGGLESIQKRPLGKWSPIALYAAQEEGMPREAVGSTGLPRPLHIVRRGILVEKGEALAGPCGQRLLRYGVLPAVHSTLVPR